MRRYGRVVGWGAVCLSPILLALWMSPEPLVHGQENKSKSPKKTAKGAKARPLANTKGLDIKAEQISAEFVKNAEELAGQYFDAGHPEKAQALLESVLAVDPQAPNIQKKLEQVKESVLNLNDFTVDVDPSQSWKPSGATTIADRALRIRTEGTYRFDAGSAKITAAGFPDKDPGEDMISGIPCGGLMGIIVTADGKSGKPFLIGESLDFTPKSEGMLLLKVNAPPGNKNSGKLRVSISGSFKAQ